MAEGREDRLEEMLDSIADTVQLLQAVLADLPIPIVFIPSLDTGGMDDTMERIRHLLQDEPIPSGAKLHLDMAVLMALSAVDVSHIANHREELSWRYDATYALLTQATAHLAMATIWLDGERS